MNATNDPHEEKCRDWLHRLGRDDEQAAPPFQRVWRAAREAEIAGRPATWSRWPAAIAATAAACLVAGFALLLQHPARESAVVSRGPGAPNPAESRVEPEAAMPLDFLLPTDRESPPRSLTQLADEISDLLKL